MDYKEFEDRQIKMSEKAQSATLGTAVPGGIKAEAPLYTLSAETERLYSRICNTRDSLRNILEHLKGPEEVDNGLGTQKPEHVSGMLGNLNTTVLTSHSILDDIDAIIYKLNDILGASERQ